MDEQANKRTFVLCSGGLDSVVVAALLRKEGYDISLLYIDYRSKAAQAERDRVFFLGKEMGLCVIAIHTDALQGLCSPMMVGIGTPMPTMLQGKAAYVPGRNLLLCSIAASYSVEHDVRYIAIGNIADGIYPDNRPEFVKILNELMSYAIGGPNAPIFLNPINGMTKRDVVRLAVSLEVPIKWTWSCYASGPMQCGVCGSCKSRRRAFAEVGIEDPVPYANA